MKDNLEMSEKEVEELIKATEAYLQSPEGLEMIRLVEQLQYIAEGVLGAGPGDYDILLRKFEDLEEQYLKLRSDYELSLEEIKRLGGEGI